MGKRKILLWADAPVIPTGWGTVSKSILKYLKDEYDFVVLGVNYFGDPHTSGYKIYPAGIKTPGDIYGITRLSDICSIEQPDIIWMINDIWVINQMINTIKEVYKNNKLPKLIVYFPVDAEDHDPMWYQNLDIVDKAVVYNSFGKKVATQARSDISYEIIGHGVDTDVFFRAFPSRKVAKQAIFSQFPELEDKLIFFSGARNQPRKRLDMLMRGFAEFVKNKNDALLYLHCEIVDAHINIQRMAKILGIEDKIIVSTGRKQKLTSQQLNLLYNACDVGINTSLGEGWGLPSVEHAATGALQIVPNHSALSELWEGCGVFIDAKIPFTMEIGTTGKLCLPEDICNSLEFVYKNPDIRGELARKGFEKFTSTEYQWKTIASQWKNLIEGL